jgi:hypothetical protein
MYRVFAGNRRKVKRIWENTDFCGRMRFTSRRRPDPHYQRSAHNARREHTTMKSASYS